MNVAEHVPSHVLSFLSSQVNGSPVYVQIFMSINCASSGVVLRKAVTLCLKPGKPTCNLSAPFVVEDESQEDVSG